VIEKGCGRLLLDGVWHRIQAGDVIFIPQGVVHALDNTDGAEDIELLAILPFTPEPGQSGVYDERLRIHGRSFVYEDDLPLGS